jgi:hypothetical protein
MKRYRSFDITYQGVEYVVDVEEHKGDTIAYIEYANIDEDIDEPELAKLTNYLIGEGFINICNTNE